MILKDTFEKMQGRKFEKNIIKTFFSLVDNESKNVLDVGCGKGLWDYLGAKKEKFDHISACDIFDDFQFEEIRQVSNTVTYKNTDGKTLPFEDNMFDLVFSMDVIEHVKNDFTFTLEKIRVAKPGGKILIGTPNYFRIGNFPLIITGKLHYPRILGHDSYGDVIHLREYKKNELNNLLDRVTNIIDPKSIHIQACFLGIPAFNIGLEKFPRILENFCQYWFVSFNKK
ncbi:MAG TPA: hypothetical protein DCS28_01325 [Candidatus Moranbacteria bacterium]|nr:hypothetical protein [Candidatus Moranbacteria bacterium]HAT74667.1 hypothetical protein [Candidatus Moranbacteria bacterium]